MLKNFSQKVESTLLCLFFFFYYQLILCKDFGYLTKIGEKHPLCHVLQI